MLPGNSAMVAALRAVTGRTLDVAGKPTQTLLHQAVARGRCPAADRHRRSQLARRAGVGAVHGRFVSTMG